MSCRHFCERRGDSIAPIVSPISAHDRYVYIFTYKNQQFKKIYLYEVTYKY